MNTRYTYLYVRYYISDISSCCWTGLGTVAGSVYAQFVKLPSTDNTPQLAQRQDTQGVEHIKCNLLQYTSNIPNLGTLH